MLNLNQSATLPSAVASHHQCKESIFNISNRAPPIVPDTAPRDRRDELHAVMGRIGCGQVLLRRGRIIEVSATGREILERECRFATGPETLCSAVRQLVNRAGAQIPAGSTSWLATSSREGIASLIDQIMNVSSGRNQHPHPARSRCASRALPADAAVPVWPHSRRNPACGGIGTRSQFA